MNINVLLLLFSTSPKNTKIDLYLKYDIFVFTEMMN